MNVVCSRIYLLDIVLALVPCLDEKRLESLEGKLKELFSMVGREGDGIEGTILVGYLEGGQTKCDEKIVSNFRRIMHAFDSGD